MLDLYDTYCPDTKMPLLDPQIQQLSSIGDLVQLIQDLAQDTQSAGGLDLSRAVCGRGNSVFGMSSAGLAAGLGGILTGGSTGGGNINTGNNTANITFGPERKQALILSCTLRKSVQLCEMFDELWGKCIRFDGCRIVDL